jgi:DNA modification methylase
VPRQSIFDESILAEELQALQDGGLDLGMIGFGEGELERLLAGMEPEPEYQTDPDDEPEVDEESTPVSVRGMVWLCGSHRVMCGDSTSPEDVRKLMAGEKALLLHADPPYGMGKEGDGVANDNLYAEKLDKFQMQWWRAFRSCIADNASAYIWGNAPDLWRLWYVGGLKDSERMTLRNEIVWAKGHGQGMSSEGFRSFAPETERCLLFMLGEQGFNTNADNYWEGWEPIRRYLYDERVKMGWDVPTMKAIVGHSVKSLDHWTSTSQWSFPTKDVYEKLQQGAKYEAFQREYDDLKREYDDLKREYYNGRAYFDNTHDNMTDVWRFDRVTGEERHDHATPKPVDMMQRAIKTSLPVNGLCAEPFGGSGSTLLASEKSGRKCYTMELQEKYTDTIIKRWQQFTGKDATLENDGRTFDEIASLCP